MSVVESPIPRPRWRAILRLPIVRIALATLFVGGTVAIAQTVVNLMRMVPVLHGALASNALVLLFVAPATALAYRTYVRLVERRPVAELSGTGALAEIAAGTALGVGLFSVVIGILCLLGAYRAAGIEAPVAALAAFLGASASGFIQELLFRGIIFRIAWEGWGAAAALALSIILFALPHLAAGGEPIVGTIAVVLQAGILLGAAYLLSGRLWLAAGLHVGWDFANDGLFGTGMDGATGTHLPGLLRGELVGPAFLTGGSRGVESSLVALLVLLPTAITLLIVAYRCRREMG